MSRNMGLTGSWGSFLTALAAQETFLSHIISPEKDEISEYNFWAEGSVVECFCLACSGL